MVGNLLGQNKPEEARRAYLAAAALAFCMACFYGIAVVALRSPIVSIFPSKGNEMASEAKSAMYFVAAYQIFDALNCVYGGVYLGLGRAQYYAFFSLLQNYVVGLPLAILAKVVGWQIRGSGQEWVFPY